MVVLKKWAIHILFFFIFIFSLQLTVNIQYKILMMTGFEQQISGIRRDSSTNWATTTASLDSLGLNVLRLVDFQIRSSRWGDI